MYPYMYLQMYMWNSYIWMTHILDNYTHIHVCIYVLIHIYIYIYICCSIVLQ